MRGGQDGRNNTTAVVNGRPIQAGPRSGRGLNGGFNGGYGYGGYVDPYYNNCFWNYWGGHYSNGWCSWFWSPFYATGLCWQNYWLYGGNWGGYYGWNSSRYRFNNSYIWLGPFLPATASFIVYDDPEPQIIYVEVPAAQGEVVVQQGVVDATVPTQAALPLEGTDPGLQRELNRAAAYYLTQGDRAFREHASSACVRSPPGLRLGFGTASQPGLQRPPARATRVPPTTAWQATHIPRTSSIARSASTRRRPRRSPRSPG